MFSINIASQSPEELTINVFSAEPSGHPLTSLLSPVQHVLQNGEFSTSDPETVRIQNNAIPQTQISEKSEPAYSTALAEQRALPVSESRGNDAFAKGGNPDTFPSISTPKTVTSENGSVPENVHSLKVQPDEPSFIETFTGKTARQNHTLSQAAAAELLERGRMAERAVVTPANHAGTPVTTGSVESASVIESPKPPVPEAGMQSTIRQTGPVPEIPLNRVGQTLIQMISKGEHKLEFRLDPPELGKLTMTVAMERDSVSVQMLTGSQAVKDLLLMQADRLRTALAGESITLGQMSVDIDNQNARGQKQTSAIETLLVADGGSESGKYQTASTIFKTQGGRLLDYFV